MGRECFKSHFVYSWFKIKKVYGHFIWLFFYETSQLRYKYKYKEFTTENESMSDPGLLELPPNIPELSPVFSSKKGKHICTRIAYNFQTKLVVYKLTQCFEIFWRNI